ncbi:hypothetical protein B0H17DRAFT_1202717 [Mycena rosella]|uniref:Uncharacterized protein n=1 Tax=Mycena rosella TaxID=1033263 RepID=A0AAD7DDN7_MYCRO|nr:hypothetical protein B0H17DRAFT_1202717 [Mycena rosella]
MGCPTPPRFIQTRQEVCPACVDLKRVASKSCLFVFCCHQKCLSPPSPHHPGTPPISRAFFAIISKSSDGFDLLLPPTRFPDAFNLRNDESTGKYLFSAISTSKDASAFFKGIGAPKDFLISSHEFELRSLDALYTAPLSAPGSACPRCGLVRDDFVAAAPPVGICVFASAPSLRRLASECPIIQRTDGVTAIKIRAPIVLGCTSPVLAATGNTEDPWVPEAALTALVHAACPEDLSRSPEGWAEKCRWVCAVHTRITLAAVVPNLVEVRGGDFQGSEEVIKVIPARLTSDITSARGGRGARRARCAMRDDGDRRNRIFCSMAEKGSAS